VATLAHRDTESGDVETHGIIALDFASGAMGTVTVSGRAAYRSYIEVTGGTGVLTCEAAMTIDHPVHLVHLQGKEIVTDELISNADAFSRMLDSFGAAIAGKETYLAPATEGLVNQRVLDAAYDSWHTGRRIDLTSQP
jgi:1,5-anhydro-D-fructose reductase (1,5-anhydro-D-mannitol-forming)